MKNKLIVTNSRIYTLDKATKANTMVIEDGIIKAIGDAEDIGMDKYTDYEVMDLKGRTVLPGFTDAHNHMLTYGLMSRQLDFRDYDIHTIEDVLIVLKEYINDNSQLKFIRCCGLDESRLKEKRFPNRQDLDSVSGDIPVIVTRVCAHVSSLNSKAIEMVDIEPDILSSMKDEFEIVNGELTGIVKENAQAYVLIKIPAYTDEEILEGILQGQRDYYKFGITGIHDPGTDLTPVKAYLDGYTRAQESSKLKMRTNLMYRVEEDDFDRIMGYYDSYADKYHISKSRLYISGVKFFADGSIGGRTAALYEKYRGTDSDGLLSDELVSKYIDVCQKLGLQVIVHAIGERAIKHALDEIEKAIDKYGEKNLRHRIEHCEICDMEIIKLLHDTKSIPVIQPAFIHHFGLDYLDTLDEGYRDKIIPYKTFLDNDLVVAMSTDSPIISVNPFMNIHSAVNRELADGEVLNPGECVEVIDAIESYTTYAAYASHSEDYLGSLSKGKYADFIVLDEDIFDIPNSEIKDITPRATFIGGELVYTKGDL